MHFQVKAKGLKFTMGWRPAAFICLIRVLALLCVIAPGYGAAESTDCIITSSLEEAGIREAAKKYLDAEIRRDLKTVYSYLAPSSIYCATHDYDAYVAEAEASPVRISGYKILRISNIRANDDKKAFPRVEKFAQVEVDMTITYIDTSQTSEVNFDFVFIKEGGKWYKG
ncbi:MAG: nuclear transport factor 2 family protein [Deltaproteobacteria bacterium]|nr:nuclear transport factor 2 family protein [Deltaproteobacteria bacterium]